MNDPIEIPTKPVMMQTNRDFRLSSMNGFVVNFEADKPARVPPHVYAEAVRIGAVVVKECEVEENDTDGGAPGAAKAAELEEVAKIEYVKQACMAIMARDDDTDFKADGYPKFNKVVAECPPEAPAFTAGDVQVVYDELRENIDLADLDD